MMPQRAIASPLTEDSSITVLDYIDLSAANDNLADASVRARGAGYGIPAVAFFGGFLLAGVLVAVERFLSVAV